MTTRPASKPGSPISSAMAPAATTRSCSAHACARREAGDPERLAGHRRTRRRLPALAGTASGGHRTGRAFSCRRHRPPGRPQASTTRNRGAVRETAARLSRRASASAAAAHDIPLQPALAATLNAFAANLVSAGVRAIPIGQTDGPAVIAALGAAVADVAAEALQTAPARRPRRRGAARRHRLDETRNPVHEAVPLMTSLQRTAARRRRRAGRLRQDRADGRALQAPARQLRHRRDHQRHLHQGGRASS